MLGSVQIRPAPDLEWSNCRTRRSNSSTNPGNGCQRSARALGGSQVLGWKKSESGTAGKVSHWQKLIKLQEVGT